MQYKLIHIYAQYYIYINCFSLELCLAQVVLNNLILKKSPAIKIQIFSVYTFPVYLSNRTKFRSLPTAADPIIRVKPKESPIFVLATQYTVFVWASL